MLILLPLVASAATPAPAPAAPPDVDAVVHRVEARYHDVSTLQAAFVQTTKSSIYGDEKQTGTLWLERPNHMRWAFDGDGKLFVADGQSLWMSTPADHQVVKSPQTEGSGGADVLLTSLANLSKLFEVTLVPAAADQTELDLVPRDADAQFKHVDIVLGANLDLQKVTLTDGSGTVTELAFTDVKLGEKLDPALFQMAVPQGSTVTDLTPGH